MAKVKGHTMSENKVEWRFDATKQKYVILLYKGGKVTDWLAAFTKQQAKRKAERLAVAANATVRELR